MSIKTHSSNSLSLLVKWLYGAAALVFCIVVVGGITRLTESGLSITEWKPVSGVIPPLNEADWVSEFEKYKQIPEYQLINKGRGMDLEQFKFIYFWEWIHRQLGRVIGLALAVPFIYFLYKKMIPAGYTLRLFALVALVGLQGTIGWWMVASGLEVRTDVSHFRLSIHLITALFLFAGLFWTASDLKLLATNSDARPARMSAFGVSVAFILFLQILLGAWVAGLNAGYITTEWPMMDDVGSFYPRDEINWADGTVHAFMYDPFLIHFVHRWGAFVALIALVLLARRVKAKGHRPNAIAIHAVVGIQILLGIATVMSGMNIVIAVLHQAVGAILVAVTARGLHTIGKPATSRIVDGTILPVSNPA
jgi:heme a synthase